MPLTETARKNHEALFPNHRSTLATTDPELIEVFDNFAFDEVLRPGGLGARTRLMAILASLIAQQTLAEYEVMLGAALAAGVTPVEAREILYHAVPYVGIAKAFAFIHATNEVLTAHGVALPLPGQSTTTPADRFEKGLALQKAIFGDRIDELYERAPESEIHIQRLLSANCFGDHQTRTGLDVKTRELLTFSILLSLGGCEPQLKGHIQGNVNVGNDKAFLLAAVTELLPFIGYPRALNAIACLNEVLPEAGPSEPST
ncbi:4-carboxymuconolactone decarboxylase [Roseiarcus fermentans]|uniref:4-carboxymuconolactone decarboxylase n=1 Tax=Roseiarcus fermentans TaxID=1473586 RepID=A0A366EQD1_9HYPH|nr:carboxymuconolactone decarboxylase family protein [Roseiarcus fermentans]RBP04623.1 4-carboxymuconolactone decarboxylase [Roseiarcus fermentans]